MTTRTFTPDYTIGLLEVLRRMPESPVQLFGTDEAAAMIGCSEEHLQAQIATGTVRGLAMIGGFFYRTTYRDERATHIAAEQVMHALRLRGVEHSTSSAAKETHPFVVAQTQQSAAAAGRLVGHFAVFNRWAEINSPMEGHFLERIAPGAFARSLVADRGRIRILLNHGRDPQLGTKPIAAIEVLREDERGAYYEARLLDGLPALLVDGLRSGQYGASFQFVTNREEVVERPRRSDTNPRQLPERTVTEARVFEFGPVTFPAYADATAGVRGTNARGATAARRFNSTAEWLAFLKS